MNLGGVQTGDVVLADGKGRRFYAIITGADLPGPGCPGAFRCAMIGSVGETSQATVERVLAFEKLRSLHFRRDRDWLQS